MSFSLNDLRSKSDDKLIALHDEVAKSTAVGVNYYLEELARRDQDRQTQAMLRYTRWITVMTVIVTVATILNLVATAVLLFR